MAARIFRINYKSDFILTMQSDAGWATPFCIKFWTGAPSIAYFAGWDGTTYVHCALDGEDPTKLHVHFDDHHLPIGDLKFQIAYHFTVEDFPNNTEDEVINQAAVIIDQDGTQMQVMLDLNGETAPEIEFNLPAYANEAQRIANENQRIANEAQRIANEEQRIANEEQRISNEEQRIAAESIRIANEESRISEFAQLKHDAEIATADANAAATLANEKAALAAEKAALSQAAAELANAKATLAQQKADYAQAQGDYAKAQGDYAKDQGNIAEADHERAESDHTRAENDHTAVEVYVDSLGAFDISAYHATGGVLAKYVDLSAALDGGDNIPEAIRKGGMSVKFVQSSDNKYVQYRLMHPLDNASTAADDFTNTANWQGVDDEPTAGSDNLVKSGGVSEKLTELAGEVTETYGSYTENPEFVRVVTDADGRILYGVKTDGEFVFGVGVPQSIKDYVLSQKASVDADVLAEKTRALAAEATKVDKEEGKSLIDSEYASTKSGIENPEFLEVTIDSEDKILEGIREDGTKVIGRNFNVGGSISINRDAKILGNMEVSGVSYKVIENLEYIAAWVDAEDKIIFGFKVDGKTYVGDANFLDDIESIKVFLANFSDKNIDWDALTSITAIESPEYIEAKTDSEGKLIAGRTTDGAAFEKVGFSTPKISVNGTVIKNIEDPESRVEITTDLEDKVVSYRKSDGTLVEPKLSIPQSLSLGEKPTETIMGIGKQASEAERYDKLAVYNLPKYGTVDIVQETFYLTSDSRVSSYSDVYVILDYEDNNANAAAKITIGYWYIKSTLTDNGDGTYSKNAGSVKLDFYAATKVTNVSGTYYVTSSLTEVVDPETGDVSYEVNEDSIEVTQIVGTPDVRTWPVDKKTEHYCVVNIDFGHYLSGSFSVGVKFQGSSTLEYRERNFRFTFYKNSTFAKKDKIKIGELIRQSGFNLKANWTDQTKLKELILNRLIISIWNTRDTDSRYPWNKEHPYSGATGTIKGFPVKVSIGGSFYGIDIFGLKKDEKNYLLEKAELDDETIIEGTGMFVSGTGGLFSGGAFHDSWSVNPEYWEDEMNDDDVLTTNNHTPADNTALTNFLTFVNGDSFDQEHAGERLDIVGWIDYFILMQVFVMYDNTSRNLIMYSDSERVKMYPFFYDLDLAWRIVDTARVHIDSDILANGVSYCEDMTMWDKLWSVYKDEIINRYCELRKTVLNTDFINTIYKSIVVNIPDEDIALQAAKWGTTVTTKDMSAYMDWLTSRLDWLDNNYFKI